MNPKKTPYMEVVFASCRKGIDAPHGGFCVKTHSEGMSRDVLEAVSSPKVCYYDRPVKELPSLVELRDDPSLFFDHPAAWLYTPVTTEGGRRVYVFARSVFVGVEYGFFDGSGQQRQGSNFVTHALVFDEPVPVDIMKTPGLFVPVSTDGTTYMEEMRELLCGEPVLLPSRNMELEQESDVEELSESAVTLKKAVEALVAEELKGNDRKKLIVRVESARTEDLIVEVMRALPEEMAETLFFTTNYGGDGLPYRTPVKVFFLNETYPESYRIDGKHIFVNLFGGANEISGIEDGAVGQAEESVETAVESVGKGWWREQLSKRVAKFKPSLKEKKSEDE